MQTDDPFQELFAAELMTQVGHALRIHEALAQAYNERTGKTLSRKSPYTTGDVRRAKRILASEGIEFGSVPCTKFISKILRLRKPKVGA